MVEVGRFRFGGETFVGRRTGQTVTREGSGTGASDAREERWDYGDLVILPPAEPGHIIEAIATASDLRFRLRPPASLGPHRAMVAVPRGDIVVKASARIGYVLSGDADPGLAAPMGCTSAIVLWEERAGEELGSPVGIAGEGFTTLGPTVVIGFKDPLPPPCLWHNGRAIAPPPGTPPPPAAATLSARLAGWIRLRRGDLVLAGGDEGAVVVRPGDHLECRCGPLPPVAVNIGLRGSA
jgi:hypothetical protein